MTASAQVIDALLAQRAALAESLRITVASINNIDPKYSMNTAYLSTLVAKKDSITAELTTIQSKLNAQSNTTLTAVKPANTSTKTTATVPKIAESDIPVVTEASAPTFQNTQTAILATISPGSGPTITVLPADEFEGIDEQVADQIAITSAERISTVQDPAQAQQAAIAAASTINSGNTAQDPAQRQQAAISKLPSPPKDWRFRVSLAAGANYLYGDRSGPTILSPLRLTDGVIFPYTPTVQVAYSATYDTQQIVHSNFKIHNYTGSSVENITVTGDFTAQDSTEAAYLLAVIHFFRSATKMFYGKDDNPSKGTPPPLLYLTGFGAYQFDKHPVVLQSFTYNLPIDVDYINAYPEGVSTAVNGVSLTPFAKPNYTKPNSFSSVLDRLTGSGLTSGAAPPPINFRSNQPATNDVTRVPTKISISLTFLPIVTRNAINTKFSLKDYASGKLLRGSQNPGTGGGIW